MRSKRTHAGREASQEADGEAPEGGGHRPRAGRRRRASRGRTRAGQSPAGRGEPEGPRGRRLAHPRGQRGRRTSRRSRSRRRRVAEGVLRVRRLRVPERRAVHLLPGAPREGTLGLLTGWCGHRGLTDIPSHGARATHGWFSLKTAKAVVARWGEQNCASGPSAGFPSFSAFGFRSAGGVW